MSDFEFTSSLVVGDLHRSGTTHVLSTIHMRVVDEQGGARLRLCWIDRRAPTILKDIGLSGRALVIEPRERCAIGIDPGALHGRRRPSAATSGRRVRGARTSAAQKHRGTSEEARRIGAGVVAYSSEHRRQEEPAEAAGRADDAGDEADALGEPLRHELEHRAVAHAEQRPCRRTAAATATRQRRHVRHDARCRPPTPASSTTSSR